MRFFMMMAFLFFAVQVRGEETIDFKKDVYPILKQNCYKCHFAKKNKGGFSFDSKETILKGGKENKEKDVIPGNSKDSVLIKLITSKDSDEYMPPKGPRLTEAEVATLKKWIDLKVPMEEPTKAPEDKK